MTSASVRPDTSNAFENDTQPKELQLLRNVVDDLDDFVVLASDTTEISTRAELDQAERDLHELYDKVTDLRIRSGLPPLILAPETEPPTYQSTVSNIPQAEVLLEWKDILERHSDQEGSLTLKFSRKVKQLDIIESLLINGEKFDKPSEGWGTSAGPFVLHNAKYTFRVSIMLDEDWSSAEKSSSLGVGSTGRHELYYEVSLFGMKTGSGIRTKNREFRIQRS